MNKPDRKTPTPVYPFGKLVLPPEQLERCPNGIRLHVMQDEDCPLTRLCFLGRGGRVEAPSPAAALMAAEMLPDGSRLFDPETTAEILDFNGANISGRCSDHYTRLDLTALPSTAAELLPVVSAMIFQPRCAPDRLEATRALLSSHCAYEMKKVSHLASRAAFRLIAGAGHPAAVDPVPEDFAGITSAEVENLIEKSFVASNVDVFVSGRVPDKLISELRRHLDEAPEGTRSELDIVPFHPETAQTQHIEHNESLQSAVDVVLPAVPRDHPDYLPLRLAVCALGGFFGSRLMQNIREDKGLTYGISASLLGMQEGGYVDISAQCAPTYTSALIDELRAELHRMSTEPLSGDELLRMRLYEQTRLAAMIDNAINAGDQYITQMVVGLPEGYFENTERITASITAEEIAAVSARYLRPEQMRIVIAGPKQLK
ncbi:MAG: insulinase family protein [Muribaculaceae bacterium]|nr:insulinase family protein [Muribaculaceae bacterium]